MFSSPNSSTMFPSFLNNLSVVWNDKCINRFHKDNLLQSTHQSLMMQLVLLSCVFVNFRSTLCCLNLFLQIFYADLGVWRVLKSSIHPNTLLLAAWNVNIFVKKPCYVLSSSFSLILLKLFLNCGLWANSPLSENIVGAAHINTNSNIYFFHFRYNFAGTPFLFPTKCLTLSTTAVKTLHSICFEFSLDQHQDIRHAYKPHLFYWQENSWHCFESVNFFKGTGNAIIDSSICRRRIRMHVDDATK